MNSTVQKITMCCTLALGAGLWGGMAQKFKVNDTLSYEPNIACMKGSPYGKVLALAMQGPIDFYWHKGKSHEDEAVLGADHDEHEHAENCGCGHHDEQKPLASSVPQIPLRERAKNRIKEMAASAHRKTNGKSLSPAHQKYLQSVTEDKLKLAYELDPSNYTNYGNFHLFIATTTYGKGDADDDAAVALARKTLEFCKKDQVDPASWITAASAAYNIIYHIGRYYTQYTIPEAKASLEEFDVCLSTYKRLLDKGVEGGRIASEERFHEMEERAKYLTKLRHAQGIYMKRVMSTKMADSSNLIQQAH